MSPRSGASQHHHDHDLVVLARGPAPQPAEEAPVEVLTILRDRQEAAHRGSGSATVR
ncbi:hypothetical protein BRM3_10000 [Brachybacterium huguangmaarense]|uniref:Uncharacterized protein n=1 Tax=Brachybacterium huguangmaarense TaxID=1652028 RepID=A0ABY6FZW4_9MICO|nr:hypothetical protein [Brachybacterium huguangmaarense]UYG15964.1 hypothetical protein BRM3_10000 [Brachybacterium huguangmaarense]